MRLNRLVSLMYARRDSTVFLTAQSGTTASSPSAGSELFNCRQQG